MFSIFQKNKKLKQKIPGLFCLDCFENNVSPPLYSLCRQNESTKLRHYKNQHNGQKNKRFVSPNQVEAKEALAKWQRYYDEQNNNSSKVSVSTNYIPT